MSDKKENNEWDDRELGALWVNTKQGSNEKYLTGHINDEKVIVFKNKFKEENAKAPDFRVYKQKELESSATSTDSSGDEEDLI
tara:strand:- start:216 stop:464 length:249 start_codon:yes stop_codon:yes gene_type:complete